MSDILAKIIERKRVEVHEAKTRRPLSLVKTLAEEAEPPRSFEEALKAKRLRGAVIAECKRQSPSAGVICHSYDAVQIARSYERAGASAISVLTDKDFFGGSLEDLSAVREVVQCPVLRKDFVIDEYQIYEARASGADTILLIAGVLDVAQLQYFIEISRELGMEPLVESHSEADLTLATATDAKILGVNCRDLKTFRVDLEHLSRIGAQLRRKHPNRLLVAESGIKTSSDIEQMTTVGYKAFLVGESLLRTSDCGLALAALLGAKA